MWKRENSNSNNPSTGKPYELLHTDCLLPCCLSKREIAVLTQVESFSSSHSFHSTCGAQRETIPPERQLDMENIVLSY